MPPSSALPPVRRRFPPVRRPLRPSAICCVPLHTDLAKEAVSTYVGDIEASLRRIAVEYSRRRSFRVRILCIVGC
ncbi:hypothetical protein HanRHA438_Chr08g0358471 [Helianthus annuus]|nr:hypothetical protein HanHA300_Chr08g0286151 [Helianthus annuus]KAJ0554126.1 hypothetical protein HanHA89_Chr08g0304161 [Helianthus annuus]KAJ0898582.1 hypothetical protein HanRHA438_Chr08g0358471 [Helianthus annuus]